MIGEAIRVSEDAATDHEAVDSGVLDMELKGVSAVSDVAVDDKFGFRRY